MNSTSLQKITVALTLLKQSERLLEEAGHSEPDSGYRADIADALADLKNAIASVKILLPLESKPRESSGRESEPLQKPRV